ncbi:Crp/Fnr family transcriptional regulator [Dulcicalothrix desertica]|uniref:Crp/Fnr family transcriptional regulator n=1 Tax=Dulcicalothrix desertica TaxID=32056 RepID=UPI000F8CDEDF|nr:Crp/Fnr family transcriptional regulator [Dulcicalothrix desertica]TWH53795.1 CRP-like cAMP-binding protein [Dulcicalothrix desertica PCC 7102]
MNKAVAITNMNNSISTSTHIQHRTLERRQLIPEQERVLWKIQRGSVRALTWDENGVYTTLGYWGVGDIVGYSLSRVQPYHLECISGVELASIPSEKLHENLDQLLSRIQRTEELVSIVNSKRVSTRIWQFLIWLSDKFSRDLEDGKLIDLHITHQEIADVLNTTRVTVTRVLRDLEDEGKLRRHKRWLIISA